MELYSTNNSQLLTSEWYLARTSPDLVQVPAQLCTEALAWLPACVPGTVAQAILASGGSMPTDNLDDFDWWYRCEFAVADLAHGAHQLCFAGLATLAQVWLNDKQVLFSRNMFLPQTLAIANQLQASNSLVICFRSLTQELNQKRERPKWKTNLVSHQQLRWLRTTLLGRMPGWSPPVAAVGPWRAVRLTQAAEVELVATQISNILSGDGGILASFALKTAQRDIDKARLVIGEDSFALAITNADGEIHLRGEASIPTAKRWWPHTHGEPVLLPCTLQLYLEDQVLAIDLGARGFKQQYIERADGQLALVINGEKIFCRGACWTIADIYSLCGDKNTLQRSLTLARDAGINMLRVSGTMVYESDAFYRLCDELGIMVWQDFMFANMDYPVDDHGFEQSISAEVQAQLSRLAAYACITVYCGNSEVQQQAAMMGQPRESWSNHFFDKKLELFCAQLHAGVVYFPSTPCEGALPFTLATGLSHYYGVGAYKRPISDAALAAVKFTPETLGFSNIPEPANLDKIAGGALLATHDPRWKRGVPRDSAAGWDFEDIRDFYLALLFNEDAIALRSHNLQRYLELSRVVTGEVIQRVFAIWRSAQHPCQGALIWFYKDLWPGAGWGIVDSDNQPKAAYYAVKRAARNLGVYFQDRGLDGLQVSVINETACKRELSLEIQAFKSGYIQTLGATQTVSLSCRATQTLSIDAMLGYFSDVNYSYRFGPRQHDVVVARLCDLETGEFIHEDFYFPVNIAMPQTKIDGVILQIIADETGATTLVVTSPMFLHYVRLELKSHEPEDNYFHLAPNRSRAISLRATTSASQPVKGYLEAVNLLEPVKIRQ